MPIEHRVTYQLEWQGIRQSKVHQAEGTKHADWVHEAKRWDLADRLMIWTINGG